MNLDSSLESLDLLTIASFLMQVQGWANNSEYTKNIWTKLDAITEQLKQIDNKLNKLLKENN